MADRGEVTAAATAFNRGMTESLAIVLAGGGERLVAWHTGVLAGLAAAGHDPRRAAAVIGTSAGALVAARLAAGSDPLADAAAVTAQAPPPPPAASADVRATFERLSRLWTARGGSEDERRRRIGALALRASPPDDERFVAAVRRRLHGTGWPPALRITAVDAERGERVAFGAADGVPLERAVAASRAIPGLQAPVAVGGRLCIDGAVGSATNADLALDSPARAVLVIAGTGVRPEAGTPEPLWAEALEREVAALEAAGRRVQVLRPTDADRVAMGPDPMSGARARQALAAGLAAARRIAAPAHRAA